MCTGFPVLNAPVYTVSPNQLYITLLKSEGWLGSWWYQGHFRDSWTDKNWIKGIKLWFANSYCLWIFSALKIDLIISLDNFRVIIVVLCCLPCLFSECCDDCVDSVYESLDVDNQSVYPFKKRHYYWFQQEKKYKSPKLLCGIIEPPNKVKHTGCD